MDRKYIEDEHIVDRYLSGDLTVREAREFEKYCLDHPDILKTMPIPVRLKARLSRRPVATSETGVFQAIPSSTTHAAAAVAEEGFDAEEEEEAENAQRTFGLGGAMASRGLVIGLAVALLAAIGGVIAYGMHASSLAEQLRKVQATIKTEQMQAPSTVQTYRVQMVRGKPQQPTLALGWLKPPQLLDVYVDVSEAKYSQFMITIDKAGEGQLMVVRRVARDSNRDVRFSLNSSAFGPGSYLLRFDGYNWRGQTEEIGWIRIDLQ
jgi:hypothetical protein